jgi:hypothetical protein
MVPRAETKSNTRAIARQERAVPGVDPDVSNGVISWQPFCILERNKLDFAWEFRLSQRQCATNREK